MPTITIIVEPDGQVSVEVQCPDADEFDGEPGGEEEDEDNETGSVVELQRGRAS